MTAEQLPRYDMVDLLSLRSSTVMTRLEAHGHTFEYVTSVLTFKADQDSTESSLWPSW